MFGIGTTEFLVILLVAVVVLGPEHLPKIVRTMTKVMSDVRRVSTDFQRTMNLEANQEEWREQEAKKKKRAAEARKATAQAEDAGASAQESAATQEAAPTQEGEAAATAQNAAATATAAQADDAAQAAQRADSAGPAAQDVAEKTDDKTGNSA